MTLYMIQSYEDYRAYLEADRVSLGRTKTLKAWLFDDVWRFQKLLRKLEYLTNCKKNRLWRAFISYRYRRQGLKCGFSIPLNVFGPGLAIAHLGTIVVNHAARVGANCRLHVCVSIATQAGTDDCAPTVGDNCYIGPGAKLFGRITIGPNTAIGANAVVTRSFPMGNVTLAGVPARIVSQKGSEGLVVHGFKESDRDEETAAVPAPEGHQDGVSARAQG